MTPTLHEEATHFEALNRTGFYGEQAAGCIVWARSTGRMLFLRRSADVQEPGTWGNPGGAHGADETPDAAALRELHEETGYSGPVELIELNPFELGTFRYSNFLAIVPNEFEPYLGWEADAYQWATMGNLPSPLHFGLEWLFAPALALMEACRDYGIGNRESAHPALRARKPNPALRDWLAGTWLTDEQGVPYVAYHGSAFAFDQFDLAKAGSGRGFGGERALFFSFDPWTATHSALVMGAGYAFGVPTHTGAMPDNAGVVYPVYLRTERPCVSSLDRYRPDELAAHLAHAQAGGWDAILFPNLEAPGERWTIAVFSADQVRSIFG